MSAARHHDHRQDRHHGHQHERDGRGHDDHDDHGHHGHHDHDSARELAASLGCGALVGLGHLVDTLGGSPNLALVLFFIALASGAFFTIKDAVAKVLIGRFEIDFLMIVAAIGAATLGKVAEGALLLFLFSLGHALEGLALRRAKRAIDALSELAPPTAWVLDEAGAEPREVPLARVTPGMRLLIRAHSRVPADGVVVAGQGAVDESLVTGESAPQDKRPLDPGGASAATHAQRVLAGTLNGQCPLEIEATASAADSTLARVARLVAEAESAKPPVQRRMERFERVFVPGALAFVVLLLFAWVVLDEPFSASFYRAMAVLVAVSPCALAIAVPSAMLAGIARAARGGVLIKGGEPLTALATVRAIAFDKTGTLTLGRPVLSDVVVAPGASEAELAATAMALESGASHPLARALIEGLRARGHALPVAAAEVSAIVGSGMRGMVRGAPARVGKAPMFEAEGDALAPIRSSLDALAAQTIVVVEHGGRVLGALAFADAPRPEAARTIRHLRALGVTGIEMLTGDRRAVATSIAATLGVGTVHADLMPADKVDVIARSIERHPTAMVGDGVNDAPALARATVGIAMGAAGSPVALESADVALMGDDLGGLPFALRLAQKTRAIVVQNLLASFLVIATLVPLTLFGALGMGLAVIGHEGVTVLVVLNALRLLGTRDPFRRPNPASIAAAPPP